MLAHPPSLLLLGHDGTMLRSLARTLTVLCTVEIRKLTGSVSALPPQLDGVVLVARGLQDDDLMRRAVSVLHPVLARALPLLAVADDPAGRDAVRARVLGAAMVLPTGTPGLSLLGALRRLLQREPQRPAGMEMAVEEVALTLDGLMQDAARGRVPDPDAAANAAARMNQAIATDGARRWLDGVRAVHDRTYRHSLLVAGLMGGFARALRFPDRDCGRLILGGLLHDVGKAMIPVEIIDKPGRLDEAEQRRMREHARLGHDLLSAGNGYEAMVLSIVRSHHEYLDGSGYPDGLRGGGIPDPVRIATLCDIFAALIEERSYKPAQSPAQASEQMALMTGRLDRDLLRTFEAVFVGR